MADTIDLKRQDVIMERHSHLLFGSKESKDAYAILKSFPTMKYRAYTILLKNKHLSNVINYKVVSVPNPGDTFETTNKVEEIEVVGETALAGATVVEINRVTAEQEVRIYFEAASAGNQADVVWSIRLHPE